jgi:cobalamin biosynthesis Mg chelatase CobN
MEKMSEAVFSGLADYGRARTYLNSGVVVVVAIVIVVVALIVARNSAKDVHTVPVAATLKDVNCQTSEHSSTDSKGVRSTYQTVTCSATADYSVDGTSYTAQNMTFDSRKSNGAVATLYINPLNPNDVISKKPFPPMWSYGIASIAILFALSAVGWAYFISRSESFAAVQGAKEVAGDVRGLFRGGEAPDFSFDSSFE